ncbi:integration host factor subunit alpha [Beijerinckia sp. L45]|uniref:integration host factor subunit alpha n=1 Tax=Beijerinckia sp. L45 TaxID=1641855 RepID=UPI00131A6625|nr:integration host factor subunit alpha [Beijerinckia sp. L45]
MSDAFATPESESAGDRQEHQAAQATFRRTATRADLLDAIYARCPALSRSQSREIFEMALEEVSQSLVRGEPVKLRSFGLFSVREKRERIGRNPRTGIEVPIKPRRVLTFRPSPVLFALVNGQVPAKDETALED